jgi:hypothetical protein
MKNISRFHFLLLPLLVAIVTLAGCRQSGKMSAGEFNRIKSGFVTPADTNKVWCYWYWLNDDISREGVTKDLEAMKAAGIGGAFIGNINPDEVNGRVPLFSEAWWDIMVHAVNEGKRLGVDIGVFNCPGWSQSGGPWVKPEMAMRYLVGSETPVPGGKPVMVKLPKPAAIFQDVAVLAIPDRSDLYRTIRKSTETLFATNSEKEFTLDFAAFPAITANTILLYPAKATLKADCELFASQDGTYRSIRKFVYDRSNNSPSVGPDITGPLAISLPSVASGNFRLVIRNLSGNEKMAGFAEIVITEEVMLEKFVEKQLGKMHPTPTPNWSTYLWETQVAGKSGAVGIPLAGVIDISKFMDTSGNLNWDAPAGKWIALRIGMTPTGTKNSPAAPQGKGYEIDKANSKLVRYHFDNYVGELLKRIPAESRPALKYVIADSYEMGSQNWTDGYADKFRARYGYDPIPYLPVLSGRVVGSTGESERFLWDLRRAVADDVAMEYVGGLRKISNENHLKTWLENYGHWGFPSEFLLYGGQSDLVSGEFWNEGELGNIECKAASSSAHIYGKPVTSAEAFTAAGNSFLRHPALLKRRGDWSYTEGINHFVVHVYIHQPDEKRVPGVNAWFSTEFNRHNTWFSQSKSWFDYLRRCQHMLQQGKYAADVCYFIGEDAPKMTGARIPALPSGYSYDYINADVIENRLAVRDGRFVLPDGMSYRLMVLPPLNTMRPELLKKLGELVRQGGTILGPKPEKSPSLQGYPGCDRQVAELAGELWGSGGQSTKSRKVGEGWVLNGMELTEALEFIRVPEDFIAGGSFPVLWTHRTLPAMDIWFLTNQGKEKIVFNPSFRVTGRQPQLWDAVTGNIRLLGEWKDEQGRTSLPLTLEPGQSFFVVFPDGRHGISNDGYPSNFPGDQVVTIVKGPWELDFSNKDIGPAQPVTLDTLTDLSKSMVPNIRYYSGTVTYSTQFELDRIPEGKVYLDLGNVGVMAKVTINGTAAGSLWMFPWKLEAGKLLKTGRNSIVVEVANLWRNRLIFDSGLPEKDRYTWTIIRDMNSGEEPPSSGLIGPVTIKTLSRN